MDGWWLSTRSPERMTVVGRYLTKPIGLHVLLMLAWTSWPLHSLMFDNCCAVRNCLDCGSCLARDNNSNSTFAHMKLDSLAATV